MTDRAAYSRVYWTIIDDPKFVTIFDDDHHLAAWLRMLMTADQAHPASPTLPLSVKRLSVRALADAGLIDLQPNSRYRIHGLDAERARRAAQATSRGHRPGTVRSPSGDHPVFAPGAQDKTRQDETRRDETSARADRDSLDTYHELTMYRPWGEFSGDKLKVAINDYGDATVEAALRAEYGADIDRKTLLNRCLARLARDADRKRTERKTTPRQVRVVTNAERAAALQEMREETA